MSARRFLSILSFLLLLGSLRAEAGPLLDFDRVRALYNDGEFEKIKVTLEDFLKRADKTGQNKEKIFAYKYLGVIYAAEPTSQTRAEAYFYQLLKLAPNAHLSGMFVSSHIEYVFQRTRERVRNEVMDTQKFDEFGNPLHTAQPHPDRKSNIDSAKVPGSHQDSLTSKGGGRQGRAGKGEPSLQKKAGPKVWPWMLGGAGILGAAGLYYYLNQPEPKPNRIPAQL